jgi:hypothetical protein
MCLREIMERKRGRSVGAVKEKGHKGREVGKGWGQGKGDGWVDELEGGGGITKC